MELLNALKLFNVCPDSDRLTWWTCNDRKMMVINVGAQIISEHYHQPGADSLYSQPYYQLCLLKARMQVFQDMMKSTNHFSVKLRPLLFTIHI